MSIKKLFGSVENSRNYLAKTNQKNLFRDVESSDNMKQLSIKQETFVPQIDYGKPENFAKFGSAYYYYSGAMGRIIDYYPYDGSDAEQNEFYNKSLDVEKYIFNNLFPRTNGYANFDSSSYIDFKGGPHGVTYDTVNQLFDSPHDSKRHSANLYDKNIYETAGLPTSYGTGSRQSNLRTNFDSGVTVEFWLKAEDIGANANSIIFDMWNDNASGSHDMGRMTIEVLSASSTSPFLFTVQSGSMTSGAPGSGTLFQQPIGQTITSTTLDDWNHYAFVFQNSGSDFRTNFYLNGYLNHTVINSDLAIGELPSRDMKARIGALITAPFRADAVASTRAANTHTLTGSVDEFRFWKAARSAEEIGRNWFAQVRGGTNTDISNATLGVYYKFNEGNSGYGYLDQNVLDYSGRITNGTWTGTPSRTLSSAIVEASAAASEYKDPIIYSLHPDIVNVRQGLFNSGSYHDRNNTSNLKTLIPSWILEEHEAIGNTNVELLTHILGAYFDKIYNQIEAIPTFKHMQMTSASYTPLPFAEHLPQSLGLYMPQLFVDAKVISRFANKTDDFRFQADLTDTKNLIYQNLYNNLTNIYKTKGTEKTIKNVFRCFNLDDTVIKVRTYADNTVYDLDARTPRLEQTLVNKKALYFNTSSHINATCFQYQDPDDTSATRGYISGSGQFGYEYPYGFTAEADFTLPSFQTDYDSVDRSFEVSSLYGMYSASAGEDTNTNWHVYDSANFQVYVVREARYSKNAFFMLSSSYYPNDPAGSTPWLNPNAGPFPILTSSVFFDAYSNSDWNISVRLKPSTFGMTKTVSGSDVGYTYDLIFQGLNTKLGAIEDQFVLTASVSRTTAEHFLSGSKRFYAGANRINFSGTVNHPTDIRLFNARYWGKFLDEDSLKQHIYDIDNAGISGSFQHLSPLDPNSNNLDLLNINTLVLDWNFNDVTSSDASGQFLTVDMSSGSAQDRRALGWLGGLSRYKHPGLGYGFTVNSSKVQREFLTNTFKFMDPESPISSDMVQILTSDDRAFGFVETIPNYHHTVEKSMYAAVSDEMLNFFAGALDFNNMIGEPVNRYRARYKKLEKLREAFFRRVSTVSDVEKYVEYYQWFDDTISQIIGQLMPASSKFTDDTMNVIESHVLERNKYKSQFPTIEFRLDDPITPIMGINERLYNWRVNHHPSTDLTGSSKQMINAQWWKERAERQKSDISSGNPYVDAERDNMRMSIENDNNQKLNMLSTLSDGVHSGSIFVIRKLAKPYKLTVYRTASPVMPIKGGVNFERNKKIDLTYNATRPHGPVNQDAGAYVPENVLFSSVYGIDGEEDETVRLKNIQDPLSKPNDKVKRTVKVQHGRDWEDGIGYKNIKSDISFPFNIISGNLDTGYQKAVVARVMSGVIITNLHNDVYGPDMESPMQGPFTNYAVGGHQSRHVKVNKAAVGSNFPTGEISMNTIASIEGRTVTISDGGTSVEFTFTASPTNPEDVDIDGDTTTTMENLVIAINSYPGFTIKAGITSNGTASLTNFVNSPDYTIGNIAITSTGAWMYAISGMAGGTGGLDRWDSRPEAWKILLGKADDPPISGAIGMVGPDYPLANAPEELGQYPHTASQKAVYYRGFTAKRPVNIRNIRHTTGSTILGNYNHNYEVVNAHGGWSNPRQFIERQPNLPKTIFSSSADPNYVKYLSSSTSVRTLLDIHRGSIDGVHQAITGSSTAHTDWSGDYSTDYLQGGLGYTTTPLGGQATTNNSVFVSKFSAPGGIEVMSRGYQDFRSGEFSVYNMLNNRNLTVKRPFQSHPGLSGTHPTGEFAMNEVPANNNTITISDGQTSRIFTFKTSMAATDTTWVARKSNTADQMSEFLSVLNSQRDFYVRGGYKDNIQGATASLNNIKHYEKGNVAISTAGTWLYSSTGMTGGTDGPEVDGIRVFDIHGNDYGHTIHAARHTERFFRDSILVPSNQGATYDEKPAFHRVHRNNLWRPEKGAETFYAVTSGSSLTNVNAVYFMESVNYGHMLLNAESASCTNFLTASRSRGFTYTGWIRISPSNGSTSLFSVGKNGASSKAFIEISKVSASLGLEVATRNQATGHGGSHTRAKYLVSTTGTIGQAANLNNGSWVHVAVSLPVSAGVNGPSFPSIYFNGESQIVVENTSPREYFDQKIDSSYSVLSAVPRDSDSVMGFGTDCSRTSIGTQNHTGAMDQISLWAVALSASEVTALYNSGIPCDITASSVYGASGSHLFAWYKLGDGNQTDAIDKSNPKAFNSSSNAIWNSHTAGNHLFPLAYATITENTALVIDEGAGAGGHYPAPLDGCTPAVLGYSSSMTYSCGNHYDNLNQHHQIPRGDRQYTWMTGAMEHTDPCSHNFRYSGYMPLFGEQQGRYSASSGWEPWMTMISGGEVGIYNGGGSASRRFGATKKWAMSYSTRVKESFTPQDFVGLNTIIYEPITASSNMLGYPKGTPLFERSKGTTGHWFPSSSTTLDQTPHYMNRSYKGQGALINDATSTTIRGSTSGSYSGGPQGDWTSWQMQGYMFNTLMLKRNGPYGYGTHAQFRRNPNHPVLRNERSSSEISVITHAMRDVYRGAWVLSPWPPTWNPEHTITGQERTYAMTNFTLPPVSMRGRPTIINYTPSVETTPCGMGASPLGNSITLKATDNNNKIFFNSNGLNTYTDINPHEILTPFDYLMATMDGESIGWADPNYLIYTENIFPSQRMEFVSSSRRRTNYDNLFWRDLIADRVTLGSTFANSAGTREGNLGTHHNLLSQSAWCLDAQEDFLTRTGSLTGMGAYISPQDSLIAYGKAGELQNNYTQYFFDQDLAEFEQAPADSGAPSAIKAALAFAFRNLDMRFQLSNGALYTRKQMLPNIGSVVPPSGMSIPEKGTQASLDSTGVANMAANPEIVNTVEPFSGEALWEADEQAGYIQLSRSLDMKLHPVFHSRKSKPWYDNYQDFRDDIRVLAKDYAIVPEFRMSQHVPDLLRNHWSKFQDYLEIPGTAMRAVTSSFYRDYTNSEKLMYARALKAKTTMTPKEIRITVAAVKKFNPYKGFYPAQRTLDLVSIFYDDFKDSILPSLTYYSGSDLNTGPLITKEIDLSAGYNKDLFAQIRPVVGPLFNPGLLYNSIKSGMAVDHPILYGTTTKPNYIYALKDKNRSGSIRAYAGSQGSPFGAGTVSLMDESSWTEGPFWDDRLPFETLLDPAEYLLNKKISDLEVAVSSSSPFTASLTTDSDFTYKLAARNFFGETANFFLRGGDFTQMKSAEIPSDGLFFQSGTLWGARLKMYRSTNGTKHYGMDFDNAGYRLLEAGTGGHSSLHTVTDVNASASLGKTGGRRLLANSGSNGGDAAANQQGTRFGSGEYPLPQDPNPSDNSGVNETFTMYSRPTAFGPPVAGRGADEDEFISASFSGAMDCVNGYNWSFTPPYYHGEAWADILFYPHETRKYAIDEILARAETVYWRADPGPEIKYSNAAYTRPAFMHDVRRPTGHSLSYVGGARNINNQAVQLSASVNMFGIERIPFQTNDALELLQETRNETKAMRWVIKPKFETPMLNFNSNYRRVSAASGSLTIPEVFGSGSVPRGMWHQFGIIEPNKKKGIFMEIGDIPKNWLAHHYNVVNDASIYNKGNPGIVSDPGSNGNSIKNKFKSLTSRLGFTPINRRRRLGELAPTRTIKEAVVLIPYITTKEFDTTLSTHPEAADDVSLNAAKQFFGIPMLAVQAAISANAQSATGANIDVAGESIRKLIAKMDKYILPPEFDFIRNPETTPIVMYIFEFSHKFHKNDLSYIWQNLAPADYKKIRFEEQSIAHSLDTSELLNASHLLGTSEALGIETPDVRFMAFKVKQKAVGEYNSHVLEQAKDSFGKVTGIQFVGPSGARSRWPGQGIVLGADVPGMVNPGGWGTGAGSNTAEEETGTSGAPGEAQPAQPPVQAYEVQYNWPYDFVSIVEGIKVDIEILFDDESNRGVSLIREQASSATTTPVLSPPVDTLNLIKQQAQILPQVYSTKAAATAAIRDMSPSIPGGAPPPPPGSSPPPPPPPPSGGGAPPPPPPPSGGGTGGIVWTPLRFSN